MSRSSATSLMVRNASGALSKCLAPLPGEEISVFLAVAVGDGLAVDPLLQNRRGLEHHHATRRDRYFGAGLRIASDPLTLLAHHERAERRQFYRLAFLQAVGDLFQNKLDKRRRFGPRQAHLLVDRLAQIDTCDCFSGPGHRLPRTLGEQFYALKL